LNLKKEGKLMAKMTYPVKKMEMDVPKDCPEDCMYLKEGMCIYPKKKTEE